jgi:hypothetical protein
MQYLVCFAMANRDVCNTCRLVAVVEVSLRFGANMPDKLCVTHTVQVPVKMRVA